VTTTSRLRSILGLAAVASLLMLFAGVSAAGALTHPKLLGPKRGTVYPVGSRPTFKVRDTSRNARRYRMYVTIANAKKFKKSGANKGDLLMTKPGDFSDLKRSGSTFTYTPPLYTFPTWYMVVPGKYYWQAFHIDCSQRHFRCHVHSKLGSFYVR
jgi:hypothetical protein